MRGSVNREFKLKLLNNQQFNKVPSKNTVDICNVKKFWNATTKLYKHTSLPTKHPPKNVCFVVFTSEINFVLVTVLRTYNQSDLQ